MDFTKNLIFHCSHKNFVFSFGIFMPLCREIHGRHALFTRSAPSFFPRFFTFSDVNPNKHSFLPIIATEIFCIRQKKKEHALVLFRGAPAFSVSGFSRFFCRVGGKNTGSCRIFHRAFVQTRIFHAVSSERCIRACGNAQNKRRAENFSARQSHFVDQPFTCFASSSASASNAPS